MNGMYDRTFTYTPGTLDEAQPIPHAAKPATNALPFISQTSGDPPSPVQASLPGSPPAHIKLVPSNTNVGPNLVADNAALI